MTWFFCTISLFPSGVENNLAASAVARRANFIRCSAELTKVKSEQYFSHNTAPKSKQAVSASSVMVISRASLVHAQRTRFLSHRAMSSGEFTMLSTTSIPEENSLIVIENLGLDSHISLVHASVF